MVVMTNNIRNILPRAQGTIQEPLLIVVLHCQRCARLAYSIIESVDFCSSANRSWTLCMLTCGIFQNSTLILFLFAPPVLLSLDVAHACAEKSIPRHVYFCGSYSLARHVDGAVSRKL
ncbi:hypothetical protein BDR07DRAFT_347195 [Suillus spraguei]|nr:hypothetical protein BDR07DRAFT_347195 [Suillus spraguei]